MDDYISDVVISGPAPASLLLLLLLTTTLATED